MIQFRKQIIERLEGRVLVKSFLSHIAKLRGETVEELIKKREKPSESLPVDYSKRTKDVNQKILIEEDKNLIKGRPVQKGSDVVMCLVNPYEHLREELKNNNDNQVTEVFLQSSRDLRKEYHVNNFEIGSPDHVLNTDCASEITFCQLLNLFNL